MDLKEHFLVVENGCAVNIQDIHEIRCDDKQCAIKYQAPWLRHWGNKYASYSKESDPERYNQLCAVTKHIPNKK